MQNFAGLGNNGIYYGEESDQFVLVNTKATEYLKQNNWAGYGNELQKMKAILSEMSTDSGTSLGTNH